MTGHAVRRHRRSWSTSGVGVVATAVVVAALAVFLADLGMLALVAIVGLVGLAAVVWVERDLLWPPVQDALAAADPDRFTALGPSRPGRQVCLAVTAAVAAGLVAWLLADIGAMALGVVGAGLIGLIAMGVAWPVLVTLVQTEPVDVYERQDHLRPRRAVDDGSGSVMPVPRWPLTAAVGVLVGLVAWQVADLGLEGLVAVLGGSVALVALVVVRDRTTVFLIGAVASLAFVLHKSFSTVDTQLSGGAVSVYVSTFDVAVVILWLLWAAEGTMVADLRYAFSTRRVLLVPPIATIALVPSLLVATSVLHGVAELVRMGWMYALFVYVAVRVRTHRHVWAVLAALALVAIVELVVVVLQWRTGGVLGLSFLGVPTQLGERVTDVESLGRPFGTIIHPVFMGAAVGSLGLLALAVGLTLRRSITKLVALAVAAGCVIPLYLSHTRASLVAWAMAAVAVAVVALRRRHLGWATVGRLALVGMCLLPFAYPRLERTFREDFGTDHFYEEIDSRLELNDVAGAMIDDHPVLGVGLNNFEQRMDPYQRYGIIFFDNPVHNLYLLYLAETGPMGLAAVVAVGLAVYVVAVRASRSRDRLVAGVGLGVASVSVFLWIEEILGFSLRQDIPLALYWILAGLAVAVTGIAEAQGEVLVGRHRRMSSRPAPTPARMGVSAMLAVALVAGVPAAGADMPPVGGTTAMADLMVTFSATERSTGVQGIWVMRGDGTGMARITPTDGRRYSWPQWAMGGSRIVYTTRAGTTGSAENVELMAPDGSDARAITQVDFRLGQPKVTPDGRHLVVAGTAPWFFHTALFRIDLDTLEARNLSAVTMPRGALHADPKLTPDGRIVFAAGDIGRTRIERMDLDGTNRDVVTDGPWFDTDPEVSPDGRQVAYASYRGDARVLRPDQDVETDVPTDSWFLVVKDLATGAERVLNDGRSCVQRWPEEACQPGESSAYKPVWTPDGRSLGFNGTLDGHTTCICMVDADGSNRRALLASHDLAVTWFDWVVPTGTPLGALDAIGTRVRASRLLVTSRGLDDRSTVEAASSDLMRRRGLGLPATIDAADAVWRPDRGAVAFSARVPVPDTGRPWPPAPPGQEARSHVTLADLDPRFGAGLDATTVGDAAGEQVLERWADGSLRLLTDPRVEDWQDALVGGDRRVDADPAYGPDGTVVVTNTSTITPESFLLRLVPGAGPAPGAPWGSWVGAVVNLTNATAGALRVDDSHPAVSPDGRRLAFATTRATSSEIAVVDAVDGTSFAAVTDDPFLDTAPAWSPDGASLVWSSYRGDPALITEGARPVDGWVLVRLDLTTGQQRVLSPPGLGLALNPVWAPEGDRIAFIGSGASSLDVWIVGADGTDPRPVQVTPFIDELHVDWR